MVREGHECQDMFCDMSCTGLLYRLLAVTRCL